ncbi:MAG TPA: hybrid sensor histidine kinase/response regulator [Myxococcales bacterium]|nr:hybrid sensor histidine kinase/response regulator [Myxococcales bacterium]
MPKPSDQRRRGPRASKVVRLRDRAQGDAPPPDKAAVLMDLDLETVARALAEMGSQSAAAAVLAEAQRTQLQAVHGLLEAKTSFISEWVPARDLLRVACVRGRNDARVRAVAPGEGPVGRAHAEHHIIREGGLWAAPLNGGEGPLGVLVVMGARRGASDPVLEALAAQVAAAWELARVKDDSARRHKDLQTAVAGLRSLEHSREELLAQVSHDLKNPLTTVKAYLAMMARGKTGALSEQQEKAVQVCQRNADRLLRMINDLLLMSRLQSGKMELDERPFGLKALTDDVMRALTPLAEQSKVRLQAVRGGEAFVRGDRERLSEAIYNLVDHAIHASLPGRAVELKVHLEDQGLASLTVRDGGPPMGEEERGSLFDAYFRPRGSEISRRHVGLALPIVAKIVHLHGGRVEARAAPGDGTEYQLSVPMFAGAVSAEPAAQAAPRAGGILLVEDDADCREVQREVLELEGYREMTATSAAEARSVLGHIRPGLVLLDLRLRDEDGRAVLHLVRTTKALEDVTVFIISGASDVAAMTAGTGADRIDGYFEKPIQLPRLLDTVASVVRPR